MKKLILATLLTALAGSPAFAQSYSGGYGTGNIAPNVTPENPSGQFRYKPNDEGGAGNVRNSQSGRAAAAHSANKAYAQSPAGAKQPKM